MRGALVCATLTVALFAPNRVEAKKVHAPGRKQLVACANDARAPGDRRRECVIELFRRHVKPGLPVGELLSWGPVSDWFDERSLFDANKYSVIPIARVPDQPVFMFKPDFPGSGESDAAIYFRLSMPIGRDALLTVLGGKTKAPDLKFAEVGLSEPR